MLSLLRPKNFTSHFQRKFWCFEAHFDGKLTAFHAVWRLCWPHDHRHIFRHCWLFDILIGLSTYSKSWQAMQQAGTLLPLLLSIKIHIFLGLPGASERLLRRKKKILVKVEGSQQDFLLIPPSSQLSIGKLGWGAHPILSPQIFPAAAPRAFFSTFWFQNRPGRKKIRLRSFCKGEIPYNPK